MVSLAKDLSKDSHRLPEPHYLTVHWSHAKHAETANVRGRVDQVTAALVRRIPEV